jgi:anti-sigma regulatory factor (Ser/Thr protein kinase)
MELAACEALEVARRSGLPISWKIAIADEGEGFDPDRLPNPLSADGLQKGSRRGVYMPRTFMDEFHVQRDPAGRTTVMMAKRVESSS